MDCAQADTRPVFWFQGASATSNPHTSTRPSVGGKYPVTKRINVDLLVGAQQTDDFAFANAQLHPVQGQLCSEALLHVSI